MENRDVIMSGRRGESSSGLGGVGKSSQLLKDSFLYLQIDDKICRLYIGKLLERKIKRKILESYKSEFQFLDNFPLTIDSISLFGSRLVVLNSELYLLGGRWCHVDANGLKRMDDTDLGNTRVLVCEPKDESIHCYPSETPNFLGPKIDPIVVNLEGKTYVLSTRHYGIANQQQPPFLFEVLHNGIWKILPNPPFPYSSFSDDRSANRHIYEYCSWGHFLLVHLWQCQSFYLFDTHKEEWTCANNSVDLDQPSVSGFVKFDDQHLIGMPYGMERLDVYKVDNTGLPTSDTILCNLSKIFDDPLQKIYYPSFILPLDDDGLMCLVYSGFNTFGGCVRVATFRVFLSYDLEGNPFLSAEFINQESYGFPDVNRRRIQSAVVMRRRSTTQPDKDNDFGEL